MTKKLRTKMNLIRHYNRKKMSKHKLRILKHKALHQTIRFVAAAVAIVAVWKTLSLHYSKYFNGTNPNNFEIRDSDFDERNSDFVVQTDEMRKARVLVGVFADGMEKDDEEYRRLFRELYAAHPKVCSLPDFKNRSKLERESCQLVYTFVVGGSTDPTGPTELLDDSIPLTLPNPSENIKPGDLDVVAVVCVLGGGHRACGRRR